MVASARYLRQIRLPQHTLSAADPGERSPPQRGRSGCPSARYLRPERALVAQGAIEELFDRPLGLEHMDGKVLTMLCNDPSLGVRF